MNRFPLGFISKLAFAFVFFLFCGHAYSQVSSLEGKPFYVPGEVLVQFKESASASKRAGALLSVGKAQALEHLNLTKVTLPAGQDLLSAVDNLKKDPAVRWAQPNYYYYAMACNPPDAYYASPENWPFLKIHAPETWGLFGGCPATPPGSSSVTVAVLDSGISRNHPDLRNVTLIGYNAITNTADSVGVTASNDDFAHGTYVAGIIAASWGSINTEVPPCNNPPTSGMAGLAPGIALMAVKVLKSDGSGTTDSIVAGTNWAVSHGARVLNFSLGSLGALGLDPLEQQALDNALANNCVIVASAGNEYGKAIDFPAAYPPVIAVGASDRNDNVAPYSNVGAGLDLVAPGGKGTGAWRPDLDIFSSFLCPLSAAAISEGGFSTMPGDANFGSAAGTSASAPFVTGAAALILSLYPTLTNSQVADRIISNADSLNGNQGWDPKTGYGRLNVYRALLPAASQTPEVTRYLNTFNSPNPFYVDVDGSTNITLAISQAQAVELTIYDTSGEVVLRKNYAATDLNNNPSNPQFKSFYVPWDGRNGNGQKVKTGVYFYGVKIGTLVGRNKIAVIQGSK